MDKPMGYPIHKSASNSKWIFLIIFYKEGRLLSSGGISRMHSFLAWIQAGLTQHDGQDKGTA